MTPDVFETRSLVRPLRLFLIVAVILHIGVAVAPGQEAEDGAAEAEAESPFFFELTVLTEHDDNVTLGSGMELPYPPYPDGASVEDQRQYDDFNEREVVLDDIVYHVKPSLGLSLPFKDHVFEILGGADFREGQDTELGQINANASALLDLNFKGGLGIEVWNDYLRTEFDQDLFNISYQSDGNISETEVYGFGGVVSYQPRERFLIEAGYDDRTEDISSDTPAREIPDSDPDLGGVWTDTRDAEAINAQIRVPVGRRVVAYARHDRLEQLSETVPLRSFESESTLVGLEFEGPRSSKIWIEGGRGSLDFLTTVAVEFDDNAIWSVGAEVKFTESSLLRLSFGEDAYREVEVHDFEIPELAYFTEKGSMPVWELFYGHSVPDESSLELIVQRTHQPSVAAATAGFFFEGTLYSARWRRALGEKFEVGLEGSMFSFDTRPADTYQKDETVSARAELFYSPRDWLRFGPYYQFTEKDSNYLQPVGIERLELVEGASGFEGNRIGLSMVVTY